jgi:hypothetical protein
VIRGTTTTASSVVGRFDAVAVTDVFLGAFVSVYGVFLLFISPLGGVWVVAIGSSLALAGAFATERVATRFDVSPARQRTLALSFADLSLALLVPFVAVNAASFGGPSVATGN